MTNPHVLLETSAGTIELELFPDKAPKTVANFLATVDAGFYAGTIFHRVIRGFMIQGGGLTADMAEKPGASAPVPNEAATGLPNDRGSVAMARTMDPHSATVQFFINTVDNAGLNYRSDTVQGYGYCAFGKVVRGMEVVDAIEGVGTGRSGMHDDVPLEAVRITGATRKQGAAPEKTAPAKAAASKKAAAKKPGGAKPAAGKR